MEARDRLTVAEVSRRSGFAPSALRFYEREGLISASRTSGGQRRFERVELRRLAFIRAARNVGIGLDQIKLELARLPDGRTPTKADWNRISVDWHQQLTDQIEALERLRGKLSSCIGCGCLSLKQCAISNPDDIAAQRTEFGAAFLPALLRRPPE